MKFILDIQFFSDGSKTAPKVTVQAGNTPKQNKTSASSVNQMIQSFKNGANSIINGILVNTNGDYTNNDNPLLLKWQQQTDEGKIANYLGKLGKQKTPGQDSEGYSYHQSAFQNMVIDMNLNDPVFATLSSKDFNNYLQNTGQYELYRGWSSSLSKDRFENAKAYHAGAGMYGEGLYFATDKSTASSYGSAMSKCALSPNARVVDVSDVRNAIGKLGAKAQSAFQKSGQTNSSFSNNIGEAQMALKMGYNVIRTSWCLVVLTRDALVVSK